MEFKLFVKDMKRLCVTHQYLPILCRRIANSCRVALYLYSEMDMLSSCFLCLVHDASALQVCRVFVATATILPGVNPREHDVPPKSRCRISTVVLY